MKLYLIPNTLGDSPIDQVIPPANRAIIAALKHFIVEDVRTARRFLKKVDAGINIDELTFYVLNVHSSPEDVQASLKPLEQGFDAGIISEAGCPAVADPGADVVRLAQQKDIQVVPLVGPSSILLAQMASGFNGQSFAFVGYLPIKQPERNTALKRLETRSMQENQSQIFIETPYRNMKMLDDIINACQPDTRLCIAADITLPTEFIKTRPLKEWKKNKPELGKRPCIFILHRALR